MKPIIYLMPAAVCLLLTSGCDKFLDAKPKQSLAIPSTLKDAQALLDYKKTYEYDASFGEISSDDYYATDAIYLAYTPEDRERYVWGPVNNVVSTSTDWFNVYKQVMVANTALETVAKVKVTDKNRTQCNDVTGQALFLRSRFFYQMATIYALAYDDATAGKEPGIPLRLNTDFNEQSTRPTLAETYDRILGDLKRSAALLPAYSISPVRPGKIAAYAMLARVYLCMRKYDQAELYADSCLQLKPAILDFNALKLNATGTSFTRNNAEVICDGKMLANSPIVSPGIDTTLYRSYSADDLRKSFFFTLSSGRYVYKDSYNATNAPFSGLTGGEIYLVKAECLARRGQVAEAMKYMSDLLTKRYKTGKYVAPTVSTPKQALDFVLAERRKELILRGLRWPDIKRLNLEGANISLTRKVDGKTYTLPANDRRFALPIPETVIERSGMPQNR